MDDEQQSYVVVTSDRANDDQDKAYLWLSTLVGPKAAAVWHAGLLAISMDLANFPGPNANAIDYEATELHGHEVRRQLYYGVRGRRTQMPYRILYTVTPPSAEDTGVIYILRVIHGARPLVEPE